MIVNETEFAFLSRQHGCIANKAGDFDAWLAAYTASLEDIYFNIAAWLPPYPRALLDIGSGLGGIDVLLARHYRNQVVVALLDGDKCGPEVISSGRPHNDMTIAQEFLRKNGVTRVQSVLPDTLGERGVGEFGLVVSFAAYGFHIDPAVYIRHLHRATHPDGVLILEVRKRQEEWKAELEKVFGKSRVIHETEKAERLVFRA